MENQESKLKIADTTLRDGAQTIGVQFTPESKINIIEQLIKLGVDIIEVGTPIASPQELEVAQRAAKKFAKEKVTLSVFARAKEIDIDHAWEAIGTYPNAMLAMLTSVSDVHIESKFKSDRATMLKYFEKMVYYAQKKGFKKILIYLEDGTRADFNYVIELVSTFIKAGCDIISIPDTVGFVNSPVKYGEIFSKLKKELDIPSNVTLSAHTHNDKGLAVANALSAIQHGADMVECTINGLGERAGNASLGAILLNLFSDDAGSWASEDYKVTTNIKLEEYAKTARLVGELCGLSINPNEPLIGKSVCTTAAGIHQDGVIKNKKTYFCFEPEKFGVSTENNLLSFNMLSGIKGIIQALEDMGLKYERSKYDKIYEQVILLAQQKDPSREDIKAIALDVADESEAVVELLHCKVSAGVIPCSAEVVLEMVSDKKRLRGIGFGDGPFAAFVDICSELLDIELTILNYHDSVIGTGRDSQMQAYVECEIGGEVYNGRGISTDIVVAGCRGFLKCVNTHIKKQKGL
jgi:2-isopropylmalate synthase